MAKLAIRGHETRGKEVIELLEMLDGKNIYNLDGNNSFSYYIIERDGIIKGGICIFGDEYLKVFTLEEFFEKYPYKVGDTVTLDNKLCSIISMLWECNNIYYLVQGTDTMFTKKVIANELKPYKGKNTNMNIEYDLAKYSYEIKNGKLVIGEKKPTYPKTYEECCDVLNIDPIRRIEYEESWGFRSINQYDTDILAQLKHFRKLIICRDAYWKIAGEELGLDKPWEPDWNVLSTKHEFILINKGRFTYSSRLLVFPTVEMRDAFYDNFRKLIEQCKELL